MRKVAPLPVVLLVLLVMASRAAAAVTIGEDMSIPFSDLAGDSCADTSAYNTFMNTALASGRPVTSPINGVVVRWRSRGNEEVVSGRFRVIHPSGGAFVGTGTGELSPPFQDVTTFDTRLPIQAGDYIGIDLYCSSGHIADHFASGNSLDYWAPPLPDGGAASVPTGTTTDYSVMLNADIEPDADHDGYGDETQDLCPTDAATHGPCPVSGPPIKDTTPPHASARFRKHFKLGAALLHGLRGFVTSNEAGSLTAVGTVSGAVAHQVGLAKRVKVASGKHAIPAPGTVAFQLRFSNKARHRLARANRFTLQIRIIVADASGNKTTIFRNVLLKR